MMKEKIKKEYLRRTKLLARSKLDAENIVRGISVWAIKIVCYTAGDLKRIDFKTNSFIIIVRPRSKQWHPQIPAILPGQALLF